MYTHQYESLGTQMRIQIWDDISPHSFTELSQKCESYTHIFDSLYSRFKPDSLIVELSTTTGTVEVPHDLVLMLRVYETLYTLTGGKINPAIGFALSDIGYDATYRLTENAYIRPVLPLSEVLTLIDETHVIFHKPALLDLGALGKGYVVDKLHTILLESGIHRFLVDGSGDIRYSSPNEPILCGLEHPSDHSLAIGTYALRSGSLCASGINRRRWGKRHHYIDPHTHESPNEIIASWVFAPTALTADALTSALFFTAPEILESAFSFEYLLVNAEMKLKKSVHFHAELF